VLKLWFDHIVPVLGRLVLDRDAYAYLPDSVRRFPAPRQLAAIMTKVGLADVRYVLTAGGIIALHHAVVPKSDLSEPAAS
jgi:demethylmenaquinone methyltransferase/2-methoxy-6-polyprenyl-1,4-benzoquinol methylase